MKYKVSEKCFEMLQGYEQLIDTLDSIKIIDDDGSEREPKECELIDIIVQNWYKVSQTFYEDGFDFSE